MTRKEAIELLRELSNFVATPPETDEALNMAIEALEQEPTAEYSSDVISRQAAVDAFDGVKVDEKTEYDIGYNDGIDFAVSKLSVLPTAQPFTSEQIQTMQELESAQVEKAYELGKADRPTDEEDQLKFYYVESLDDYWVGRRLDNFYYATWHGRFGFIWSHSKYLPWGEHIVDENTLWKEHTYPSEPKEIPFTEWIVGFVKKYFADRPTGHWIDTQVDSAGLAHRRICSICEEEPAAWSSVNKFDFCPNCGARMESEE